MEERRINTDKRKSLKNVLITSLFLIGMIFSLICYIYNYDFRDRDLMFFLGCICIPTFVINLIELIKPSTVLIINENGIQFRLGFRFFYTTWNNIEYIGDGSSSRSQRTLFGITPLLESLFNTPLYPANINKQISVGFLHSKMVIEKESILKHYLKRINGEINIDINRTNYGVKELLNILEEYAKKYNPSISIIENTNIVEEIY